MKIADVSKLPPLERLIYWMHERHQIYLRRKVGKPKPWTDDEILQSYFFTNPYRENDKTTVWFRENVRDPLRNDPAVLLATVIFRWFNYIPTGEALLGAGLLTKWNAAKCVNLLSNVGKVFTGAYMIKSPTGERKLESIPDCISNVWNDRKRLIDLAEKSATMQEVHTALCKYPFLGKFMSYEIVCDLRYTYLLEKATDIDSWCSLGPGGVRGILRVTGHERLPKNKYGRTKRKGLSPPKDWQQIMQRLLAAARRKTKMRLEMREIEHSLCEWDKYERARLADGGKMKRRYAGV